MKKLLVALIIIITLVIAFLAFIWFYPGVFLNEKNLNRVVMSAELDLSWTRFQLDFQNTGVLSKVVLLDTENLCFSHPPVLDFCFEKAYVQFHFSLLFQKPFIAVRDLDLELTSRKFYVTLPEKEKAEDTEAFRWPRLQFGSLEEFLGRYLTYLPEETIKNIRIDIDPLVVNISPQSQVISTVTSLSDQEKVQLNVATVLKAGSSERFVAKVEGISTLRSPLRLQINGDFNVPGPGLKSELEFVWQERPEFTIATDVRFKKMKTQLHTKGILNPNSWTLHFNGHFQHTRLPFDKLRLRECELRLNFQNYEPSQLKWPCTINISGLRVKRTKGLPNSMDFLMDITSPLNFDEETFSAHPVFSLEMKKSALGELMLDGRVKSVIDLSKKEITRLKAEELRMELLIPSLKDWERLLRENRWAIPAPLNVLQGTIHLKADAEPTELLRKNFILRSVLTTDLTSKTQALKTTTDINLDIDIQKPQVSMTGKVALNNIAIDLPYLGIEQPPQFKPDSRFLTKKERKAKIKKAERATDSPPVFVLEDLRIQTTQPMLFSTRLLQEPIPIDIDYHIKKSLQLSGQVLVRKMGLEIFKRKATLEKFNVTSFKDSDVQDLDGLITYKTSEVLIKVLIVGTTEKPTIELLSEPPLSRQQILSVLLYNKSLQQLADEDKSTATQMDQALLNNAFGLLSLFYLSSTPIESVYYDPTTQSYTAQVRLDDQTSLSLGSDFEKSQQFTLRRRLGGPWSISTELEQTEEASDVVTTLIEWFKRF